MTDTKPNPVIGTNLGSSATVATMYGDAKSARPLVSVEPVMHPKRPGPKTQVCASCGRPGGLKLLGGTFYHPSCWKKQFQPEGNPWDKRKKPRGF